MLAALSRILDPDFGMNIVDCGFIKDLDIDSKSGRVAFRMELTTPACPIKDDFEQKVGQSPKQLGQPVWETRGLAAERHSIGPCISHHCNQVRDADHGGNFISRLAIGVPPRKRELALTCSMGRFVSRHGNMWDFFPG